MKFTLACCIISSAAALISLTSDDPAAVSRHVNMAENIDKLIELLRADCPWGQTESGTSFSGGVANSTSRRRRSTPRNESLIDVWKLHFLTGQRLEEHLRRDWIKCQKEAAKYELDWFVDFVGIPELYSSYLDSVDGGHQFMVANDWTPNNLSAQSVIVHLTANTIQDCVTECSRKSACRSVVYSRGRGICSLLSRIDSAASGQLRWGNVRSRGPGLIYVQPRYKGPLVNWRHEGDLFEYSGCVAAYHIGPRINGIYKVNPTNDSSFLAWCDFDESGGWLVIQRRINGSVNFYRNWAEYKNGFGDPRSELWIGNERLHNLTLTSRKLSVYLEDFNAAHVYANYSTFQVSDVRTNYMLTVGGYSGNAGDSLNSHNGLSFSTKDRDNDRNGGNCAASYQGGWWYNSCHHSNLNGKYIPRDTVDSKGLSWKHWKNTYATNRRVVMRVQV